MLKSRLKTAFMLFPTAVIWGFAFVAQVLGSDHVGAFTFNGIRFLLGGISLLPLCLLGERERELSSQWRRRRHRYTALIALLAGVALFVASAFQQLGTMATRDPGKAGFITGLYTVFTPVLYFMIFRKKTGVQTWLGCLLATIGLYLICLRDGGVEVFGKGELLLLCGSLFWAVHILIVDRFVDSVSPLRFSAWQFLVSGLLGMIAAFLLEEIRLEGVWQARWALLYCGVLSVGVAYTLQVFGQRDAEPTHAAIIFSTESVFAVVGGLLWNLLTPEHLHVTQDMLPIGYLGCLIIFAGIVVSQLRFHPRKKQPDSSAESM